jgi:hypothetical protein
MKHVFRGEGEKMRRLLILILLLVLSSALVMAAEYKDNNFPKPNLEFQRNGEQFTATIVATGSSSPEEEVEGSTFSIQQILKNARSYTYVFRRYYLIDHKITVTYRSSLLTGHKQMVEDGVCDNGNEETCSVTYQVLYNPRWDDIRLAPTGEKTPSHKYQVVGQGNRIPMEGEVKQEKTSHENAVETSKKKISLAAASYSHIDADNCIIEVGLRKVAQELGIDSDSTFILKTASKQLKREVEGKYNTVTFSSCEKNVFQLLPENRFLYLMEKGEGRRICEDYGQELHCTPLEKHAYPVSIFEALKSEWDQVTLQIDKEGVITWGEEHIRFYNEAGGTHKFTMAKLFNPYELNELCNGRVATEESIKTEEGISFGFKEGDQGNPYIYDVRLFPYTFDDHFSRAVIVTDVSTRDYFPVLLDCSALQDESAETTPEATTTPSPEVPPADGGRPEGLVSTIATSDCVAGTACSFTFTVGAKRNLPETCLIGFTNGKPLSIINSDNVLYKGKEGEGTSGSLRFLTKCQTLQDGKEFSITFEEGGQPTNKEKAEVTLYLYPNMQPWNPNWDSELVHGYYQHPNAGWTPATMDYGVGNGGAKTSFTLSGLNPATAGSTTGSGSADSPESETDSDSSSEPSGATFPTSVCGNSQYGKRLICAEEDSFHILKDGTSYKIADVIGQYDESLALFEHDLQEKQFAIYQDEDVLTIVSRGYKGSIQSVYSENFDPALLFKPEADAITVTVMKMLDEEFIEDASTAHTKYVDYCFAGKTSYWSQRLYKTDDEAFGKDVLRILGLNIREESKRGQTMQSLEYQDGTPDSFVFCTLDSIGSLKPTVSTPHIDYFNYFRQEISSPSGLFTYWYRVPDGSLLNDWSDQSLTVAFSDATKLSFNMLRYTNRLWQNAWMKEVDILIPYVQLSTFDEKQSREFLTTLTRGENKYQQRYRVEREDKKWKLRTHAAPRTTMLRPFSLEEKVRSCIRKDKFSFIERIKMRTSF